MKIIPYDFHSDIYLKDDEVKALCKPGHGADTCSWLVCGPKGFECLAFNKPHSLVDRHMKKEMVALRDGCDFINELNLHEYGEFKELHIFPLELGYGPQ